MHFSERFIYHMVYALKNYEFEYFLRLDDDYFICLKNFLHELPASFQPNLHWGWCHRLKHIMRAEESVILFSVDIVLRFLKQNVNTMKCHPFAGQMIAQWTVDMGLHNFFRHDNRLHHTPVVSKQLSLLTIKHICRTFIGIHGSYPKEMRILYKHRGRFVDRKKSILDYSFVMVSSYFGNYTWRSFGDKWRFKPKLCISNPTWNLSGFHLIDGSYSGREQT